MLICGRFAIESTMKGAIPVLDLSASMDGGGLNIANMVLESL